MRDVRGFTLVELLTATTITALVLGGAYFSLSVILRAYQQRGGAAADAEIANLILTRMGADLNSAFLSPHEDRTRFVGLNETNGEFGADTLTFISAVSDPTSLGEGSSDLAEVQYYIDLDDSTPERWLVRRFDNTPDEDPFAGGQIALLGPRVYSLDFQYYDGLEWLLEWDSDTDIPLAVNVSFRFFRPTEIGQEPSIEDMMEHSATFWLPLSRGLSEATLSELEGGTAS